MGYLHRMGYDTTTTQRASKSGLRFLRKTPRSLETYVLYQVTGAQEGKGRCKSY